MRMHEYDWAAMRYEHESTYIDEAFVWAATPQGHMWWQANEDTAAGAAEYAHMRRLFEYDLATGKYSPKTKE